MTTENDIVRAQQLESEYEQAHGDIRNALREACLRIARMERWIKSDREYPGTESESCRDKPPA
jgi:hypothetical protein